MTAPLIEPFESICRLDPPVCRQGATSVPSHNHAAEAGAPPDAPRPLGALDLSPTSAYELVTRQMIEATQRDVAEIKGRINNLMVMVCGAVLVNIVLRMAGLG